MQTSFDGTAGTAGKEYGNSLVVMHVRIAERRPVKNQRVVEQRAVTIGHLLQLVQKVRNHADVIFVDRSKLCDPLLILSVVRSSMESDRNAAFREGSSRRIAA